MIYSFASFVEIIKACIAKFFLTLVTFEFPFILLTLFTHKIIFMMLVVGLFVFDRLQFWSEALSSSQSFHIFEKVLLGIAACTKVIVTALTVDYTYLVIALEAAGHLYY
jgi:hypothetical protein